MPETSHVESVAAQVPLAKTPLCDWHAAHGGRLVDFAGWLMPVQYSTIVDEHTATRTRVTLFDISHMGRLRFDGPHAAAALDQLVTRDVTRLKPGQIRYALVCNDAGGILDDVLVYHLQDAGGGSYYLLVVNAGNRDKIVRWITNRGPSPSDVPWTDLTTMWSMVAVQGPRSTELLQPIVELPLDSLKYYYGAETRIAGHGGIVTRTGYTGEDGFELIVGAGKVAAVWEDLMQRGAALGIAPAGLGCRDTLRLEAGMPLYGHELSETTNPFEAGLAYAVDLNKPDFIGQQALAKLAGVPGTWARVGLTLEGKRVPREGYPLVWEGRQVGHVTSGTFSPTLSKPIAMGYVERAVATVETGLGVDIRGRVEPARIVPLPFYRR